MTIEVLQQVYGKPVRPKIVNQPQPSSHRWVAWVVGAVVLLVVIQRLRQNYEKEKVV